jgi:hypothetical protein
MGIDIEYIMEVQHNGRWVGLFTDQPWSEDFEVKNRSYSAFARLIGLRNPGIPTDRSDLTDYHAENAEGNMHYPGWLPLRAFCGVYEERARKNGSPNYYGSAPWEKLFGHFFFYEGWQYRVIFWMDSPWDEDSLAGYQKN